MGIGEHYEVKVTPEDGGWELGCIDVTITPWASLYDDRYAVCCNLNYILNSAVPGEDQSAGKCWQMPVFERLIAELCFVQCNLI